MPPLALAHRVHSLFPASIWSCNTPQPWCKYPFFLEEVEMEAGHGAPGCSQRGLEMLVLPKATSYF